MKELNYEEAIQSIRGQLISYLKPGERKKAIIGVSGGIDSAVVANLCVNAIGKRRVFGVLMPYGSQDTKDAELVVNHLGIPHETVNIERIVDDYDFLELDNLAKGNIMARTRMTTLYAFANKLNGLVIGTGNKTEIKIGYFTKYGDGGVDIEPIGDLYKTEIFKIAKLLGLPKKIINKKPSAELWEGQTDEDEIGMTYSKLDDILRTGEAHEKDYVKVQALEKASDHKRNTPPIFRIRGPERDR